MEIITKGIPKCSDEILKDAFIYFYIAIEENEHFKEKNIIVQIFNTMIIQSLKDELAIRDISISNLTTRAITIINVNKSFK